MKSVSLKKAFSFGLKCYKENFAYVVCLVVPLGILSYYFESSKRISLDLFGGDVSQLEPLYLFCSFLITVPELFTNYLFLGLSASIVPGKRFAKYLIALCVPVSIMVGTLLSLSLPYVFLESQISQSYRTFVIQAVIFAVAWGFFLIFSYTGYGIAMGRNLSSFDSFLEGAWLVSLQPKLMIIPFLKGILGLPKLLPIYLYPAVFPIWQGIVSLVVPIFLSASMHAYRQAYNMKDN